MELDWDLMMQIKRDICLLYPELAEHPAIDGDLAFSTLYTLPYWQYPREVIAELLWPDEEWRPLATGSAKRSLRCGTISSRAGRWKAAFCWRTATTCASIRRR